MATARALVVLALVLPLLPAPAARAGPTSRQLARNPSLTIVRDGRAKGVIIYWSRRGSSPVPAFAASELQAYMRRVSGAKIPVLPGSVQAPANVAPLSTALVLVSGDAAKRYLDAGDRARRARLLGRWLARVAPRVRALRQDGYVIAPPEAPRAGAGGGEVLVLAGANSRGTLYAAYDLLEQLGVRFYAPTFSFYRGRSERIPRSRTITLAADARTRSPSLSYRRKYVEEGDTHTRETLVELIDWMAKNRLNVLVCPDNHGSKGYTRWDDWRDSLTPQLEKRGLLLEVGGHGYDTYLPRAKYAAQHPEWFAGPTEPVANGDAPANVFHVANDSALRTYVGNVVAYLKARPEIDIFDAWPPDAARWPKRDVEAFGGIPNANAAVTARLTAALKRALPHVRVETVAYGPSSAPPDAARMYGASNIINLAPYGRSYTEPLSGPNSRTNRYYSDLIRGWRASFGGSIGVYEYYRKYSWHSLPVVLPKLIGQDIPYYVSLGVDGLGTYSEPGDWLPYELTHRLVAAMSWNASLDPDAYVATYVRERYGPAAGEMSRFYELLEKAGGRLFDRPGGNYGDLQVVTDARAMYREAAAVLAAARARVEGGSAAYLLERLSWSLEFAVADTEISYYRLLRWSGEVARAKQRTQELVERHRFDGVVAKNVWTLDRYVDGLSWSNVAYFYKMYRTGDGVPPKGSVSVNQGARASGDPRVSVLARATDIGSPVTEVRLSNSPFMTAYTLTWGVTLPYTGKPISWDLTNPATGGWTGQGERGVWVQWRDQAGNWSLPKKDTIRLDARREP